MTITLPRSTHPSDRLLTVLADFEQILVIMHDNPDPDAIATGWAILCLVEEQLKVPVRLVGGGAIVRAENKQMVKLLSPPIELVSDLTVGDNIAAILVDCGIGTTNHLGTRAAVKTVAVIDHHQDVSDEVVLPFKDIRLDAAASASIAASYLREQQIEPGMKLATAILYAIRSETSGSETIHSSLDDSIVKWTTESADSTMLAEIENAPLEREYFSDLALALQNTFVYDDVALCFLPHAYGAEIVGEVADLLVRCYSVHRVLCAAIVGDDLLVSARTSRASANAAKLLQTTLDGLGGCGGHSHRAGGKVANVRQRRRNLDDLHDELRQRWLKACEVTRQRGTRLVARRDIVENL